MICDPFSRFKILLFQYFVRYFYNFQNYTRDVRFPRNKKDKTRQGLQRCPKTFIERTKNRPTNAFLNRASGYVFRCFFFV